MPVLDIDEPSIVEGQSGTTTLTSPSRLPPSMHPRERGLDHDPWNGGRRFRLRDRERLRELRLLDLSETVEVTVMGDDTHELDETVLLDLVNGQGAPVGDPQGIGIIGNDDAAPVVTVGDVAATEGNTGTSTLSFVVTLTARPRWTPPSTSRPATAPRPPVPTTPQRPARSPSRLRRGTPFDRRARPRRRDLRDEGDALPHARRPGARLPRRRRRPGDDQERRQGPRRRSR